MTTFPKALSDNVRQFMQENRMTQTHLALFLKITQSSVSSKLNGIRPWNLSDIERLADLGVEIPPFDIGAKALPVEAEDEKALF